MSQSIRLSNIGENRSTQVRGRPLADTKRAPRRNAPVATELQPDSALTQFTELYIQFEGPKRTIGFWRTWYATKAGQV